MEWVDGGTLERLLLDRGRLDVAVAARVARDIALALGAAHASGIVHRDVKPSNVLIDRHAGTAKLTDFGAAKRVRPEAQALTAHGQTVGTPRYMAPEQVNGDPVDARTDLWALGATLYEMLAGRPAFQAGTLARLYLGIMQEAPPRLDELRPGLPPELTRLVERLLAKSPADRPEFRHRGGARAGALHRSRSLGSCGGASRDGSSSFWQRRRLAYGNRLRHGRGPGAGRLHGRQHGAPVAGRLRGRTRRLRCCPSSTWAATPASSGWRAG